MAEDLDQKRLDRPAELLSWSIGNRARSYDVLVVLLAAEAEPHNYAKVGLFLQGRVFPAIGLTIWRKFVAWPNSDDSKADG